LWVFRDVPSKVPDEDSTGMVRYKFENTFCNTTVTCEYSKGEAIFRSANVSGTTAVVALVPKHKH
jgi:hypothetical protein